MKYIVWAHRLVRITTNKQSMCFVLPILPLLPCSRVEYLTLLGKGQLFDEAVNENESKQGEVTDMYIYTGKGVEKVSINTGAKEKTNEMHKNKRYQYLKDKITNALKNQEIVKQNTSENEFPSANENDPKDVFIFDKLKNEINILSTKELKEEEELKRGIDNATVDTHPLEGLSFPHTDGHKTEDIFPATDVHAEAIASVTSNHVGESSAYVTDNVGILSGQGGYNHHDLYREDNEPLCQKDESELLIQSEERANLDDEKKETPNEVQTVEENSTKQNGEFFIYTEKCSDISSETEDDISSESEVDAPKWESQPERRNFMPGLKKKTGEVRRRENFQKGRIVEKRKNGRQVMCKRGMYEGGSVENGWHEEGWYEKDWYEKDWYEKDWYEKGWHDKGLHEKGWHGKGPAENSCGDDSQGEYSRYKNAYTKQVQSTRRLGELHNVEKEMHHLNVEINKVKDKMKIINNKKNGRINLLNKKINSLKSKLSDTYVNNLNDDINIINSQIDILFIKKISKMYMQINYYVKNVNDQIVKNLSTQKTMDNLDASVYSHLQRQISNIKMQVNNLHDQLDSHMYQQKGNKMFNQMNSQINNTSNQIGRHISGQLDCQRVGLITMDSKVKIPNEQWSYHRNSKGSIVMEEDISLSHHERKMHKKTDIVKKEDYLYRDNPLCNNTYKELHPQINFGNADEGSDGDEDANYYNHVNKHHNGSPINVEEYLIEGNSYSSDASFTKYGIHGGKTIRGRSKGYNSSDSCRSKNSKRRKYKNHKGPIYHQHERKKKLINLFNHNIKWGTDKCGNGMDTVKPQWEICADGVRSRSGVDTSEHTDLRNDENPLGGQAVSCGKEDRFVQDQAPSAQFGDQGGRVGTVQATEVVDVEEVIRGKHVMNVGNVSDVINGIGPSEVEETADKRPNAEEEAYRPFSDQKLMYLKKKLMQLNLFKRNQKRKNEEDGLNQYELKADTSEQTNEKEKRMAPMEVGNGPDKDIELVSHAEKGRTLENEARSKNERAKFMLVEERQETEGGSSVNAYDSYNTIHHWEQPSSQNDRRRRSYPNGNINNANESRDFMSMFQKLVLKDGENGQREHKVQNSLLHFYCNTDEDYVNVANGSCLGEKSTLLPDGNQRNMDGGGKNVDMFRHFFFLKDDMKASENIKETTSMDNTSIHQNGVGESRNGWGARSSYASGSQVTNENWWDRKNAQIMNSFTIDQIYDYTVDYYHQMRKSKEGNDPNTFTNVSDMLNEKNKMDL
eukprot:XP_002260904.1 hypothetical protein, conserved in Plasmodium species [Plasmodium knowlesi strain H]